MCGLLFTNDPAIDRTHFLRGLKLMQHRGPDVTGCYSQRANQFGHQRLSILDLDPRSNQPFVSRDGRYHMVYNGEIYNFRELAQRHGIAVDTTGDTEVLIQLYALLGEKMLSQLNGMFSIVIWDSHTDELFAARDRLGVKPLYHREHNGFHTFASEIAALLELHPDCEVDEFAVRQYLKLRCLFNGRTLYRGVSMFPAGCYFKAGRIHRYWRLPEGPQEPPSDEELRDLVTSAVESRTLADVPVGSYLSGGLDSTIVAGLSRRPHTWTVGSESNNEFKWAQIAARRFGSDHHEVLTNNHDFFRTAKDLIQARREPLSVPNEVLLYEMTRAVKQVNTVILSGEGADELFFGYDRIFTWASRASTFDLVAFDQHYSYGKHEDMEVLQDALEPFMERGSPLDIAAAFFQVAHLHGLLRRLDNSTMQCSVEGRVPFVDYRLVERMAGVSFDYRCKGGVSKAPLKRVFADLVPQEIADRPKVGFPVDLASVFDGYTRATEAPMDAWFRFNLEVLGINV